MIEPNNKLQTTITLLLRATEQNIDTGTKILVEVYKALVRKSEKDLNTRLTSTTEISEKITHLLFEHKYNRIDCIIALLVTAREFLRMVLDDIAKHGDKYERTPTSNQ